MIKYLSLFSGIGAFEKALENLSIPYELVGYCEIDKYASKAYSIIHNVPESLNFGDITLINEKQLPKDIDLVTYGFPCQDISLAGKQKGFEDENGNKTRSGLFFDALRIIEECRPQIAIAENVKNLTGKRFTEQFNIVLNSLESAGYNNYWKVLNAKDYEIPQNIEKIGVTDYWIIFSEVTERGDNVGYFIIGALCFISGLAMGVFLTALIVAGADDNIGEVNELGDDENEL